MLCVYLLDPLPGWFRLDLQVFPAEGLGLDGATCLCLLRSVPLCPPNPASACGGAL